MRARTLLFMKAALGNKPVLLAKNIANKEGNPTATLFSALYPLAQATVL
jgi:hypothetical protein